MDKTFKVKSITISRKPGKHREDGLWTVFIGLFDENNPHLKARAPFEVLDLKDVEKVRLHELRNVSFYLAGNDLIINNLIEITIKQEGKVVTFSGKQNL